MLPLIETHEPQSDEAFFAAMRDAIAEDHSVYPLGGRTAIDRGLRARVPGVGLSTHGLNRVIDYPARDLTITVEAGLTIAELQATLAAENQELPIDIALPERATVGGAIAVDASGPRRYGRGTLRDSLIGIEAIDGEGRLFHAGGRVVKNVAGYDFCRLLIGSHGVCGIVTKATFKVVPISEAAAAIVYTVADLSDLDSRLALLSASQTRPVAIETVGGPRWRELVPETAHDAFALIVAFEGSRADVDWQLRTLEIEMSAAERTGRVLDESATRNLIVELRDWSCREEDSILLRIHVRPSRVAAVVGLLKTWDERIDWHAHAGDGVVSAKLSGEPQPGLASWLIEIARPAIVALEGTITPLRCPARIDLTQSAMWGHEGDARVILNSIRDQFDPHRIINPGRF